MKYIIIIAIILHSIFSLGQSDTTYYLATGEVSVFAFESEPTFSNVSTCCRKANSMEQGW